MKPALLLLIFVSLGYSGKILLLPSNMKSHVMSFGQTAKALAANGNNITVLVGSKVKIVSELATGSIR